MKEKDKETARFEALANLLERIERGDREGAVRLYADLTGCASGQTPGPDDLGFALFGRALIKRLDRQLADDGNLYLQSFEISQIDLFNLLACRLPFATCASRIANDLLLHLMDRETEITILDIGIGTGRQMLDLLDRCAAEGYAPKLTVCGIEPNRDSLEAALRQLEARASEIGVELTFVPVASTVEDLAEDGLLPVKKGRVLVNAAFALHHIRDLPGDGDSRDRVLRAIRSLDPAGVVLCEPDSDHHRVDPAERLRQSWRHYGAVFACIDALDIADAEKRSLKLFFGREIDDVLGCPDESRTERHESTPLWLSRLRRAGFAPYEGFRRAYGDAPEILIRRHAGYYGLEREGVNVSSVICAVPAP